MTPSLEAAKAYHLRCTLTFGDIYAQILIWMLVIFASLAAGLGPEQEIYSIDESFIDLQGVKGDLVARARAVRARILAWTGIPCGIGIAPTKTLAKLANHIAKTAERKPGSYPDKFAQVCDLASTALTPENVAAQDAVMIVTPHRGIDWDMLQRHARLIIDTRGQYRTPHPNVIQG